jgi:hypothetical protein
MTSVTISEKLRKRLKKLAAEYDTTQGEIIERALDMMEGKVFFRLFKEQKQVYTKQLPWLNPSYFLIDLKKKKKKERI